MSKSTCKIYDKLQKYSRRYQLHGNLDQIQVYAHQNSLDIKSTTYPIPDNLLLERSSNKKLLIRHDNVFDTYYLITLKRFNLEKLNKDLMKFGLTASIDQPISVDDEECSEKIAKKYKINAVLKKDAVIALKEMNRSHELKQQMALYEITTFFRQERDVNLKDLNILSSKLDELQSHLKVLEHLNLKIELQNDQILKKINLQAGQLSSIVLDGDIYQRNAQTVGLPCDILDDDINQIQPMPCSFLDNDFDILTFDY